MGSWGNAPDEFASMESKLGGGERALLRAGELARHQWRDR